MPDNELPDYIMVMMANNKTMAQVNQDLQLFLGEHTNNFTGWLQEAVANPDILRRMVTPRDAGRSLHCSGVCVYNTLP